VCAQAVPFGPGFNDRAPPGEIRREVDGDAGIVPPVRVQALERLEEGRYGICTSCGGAIPFERLFVFPEAPECASCVD